MTDNLVQNEEIDMMEDRSGIASEEQQKYNEFHEDSTVFRQQFHAKYGCYMNSVWDAKYNMKTYDIEGQNARTDHGNIKHKAVSGKNVRHKDKFKVSIFPKNICKRIVRFLSEPGDIVLDPCAGHNSRMQTTFEEGRHYIGYDVSHDYMEMNRQIRDRLLGKKGESLLAFGLEQKEVTITLHEQSSEKMIENDESVDFVFTSPPYWDLEFYGEEAEQLGYKKSYEEFLAGIKRILTESKRVLKTGKYCAFNINDFRKDGKFYAYHADIIRLGLEVGFKLHDVIIMKWANSMQSCFSTQLEARKHTAKQHEFIIVFKK